MNPPVPQRSYPFGLALFALLLAFYKSACLVTEMGASGYVFWLLIGLDGLFLALLFMMALLHGFTRSRWLRAIIWLMLVSLTGFYLVDSFVLLALDEHAGLFEIGRYAPEWGVVLSFFDNVTWLAILLWLVSMFVLPEASVKMMRFGLVVLVATIISAGLGAAYAPQPLRFYAILSSHQLIESMGPQLLATSYSPAEVDFYAGLEQEAAAIPASKPDIILLIVESLSSINSSRLTGGPGMLDDFDRLSEKGLLFTNFFANHQASEGGLIALLGGFPPMHFPTASPYMFDEFAIQATVIDEYRQLGYFTEFLTNADLGFIGLNRFLKGLGLDLSRGRDEVDEMRAAPRVVQDAPSDAWLYREALLSVRRLMSSSQPFFLTIATTSTHLPYTHPEGGADTPEAVWAWGMKQLLSFYAQLLDNGYFDNGILLITGDHRQMQPLNIAEIERYGDSARARVPLLVIGNGYTRGQLDERFFQQSDLLRMLGKIGVKEEHLSPHPIWVERYNRKYGRIELINRLSVFDEADGGRREYRIRVPGHRIEWLDEKPGFERRIEARIHSQRSLHQQTRSLLKQQPDAKP